MDRSRVAAEDSPDIFKQSGVGMMREKAAVYGETMSETTSDEAHKASPTAEALFSGKKLQFEVYVCFPISYVHTLMLVWLFLC